MSDVRMVPAAHVQRLRKMGAMKRRVSVQPSKPVAMVTQRAQSMGAL
jgi:hypothetical protein